MVLTGAISGFLLSAAAMAQTSGEDPLPAPQSRPSVQSYSLPPGPDSNPKQNGLQGPVDAEIPLTAPTNVAPSTAPARASSPVPAQSGPAAKPATTDSTSNRLQPPVKQARLKPEVDDDISAPESGSPPAEPIDVLNEHRQTSGASADSELPPTEAAAESVPEKATNDWILLAFAALLFALLGAFFLWRASRAKPQQAIVTEPDRASASSTGDAAKPNESLRPALAITIGFLPRSANTTLFNAVLGFELTLSNDGGEDLSDIRVSGTMAQADDHGTRDSVAAGLSLLQATPNLTTGETGKIVAEFRVPLAGIHPILFGSQALFVPLVQISIEFTDASGFQHFQTAAFLVGQEHQPPRPKMAPFRLDLGPRSFAPLGHRPFVAD
tara:strand:+ start:12840 stop:13988 length:1149 start_codon:yes stop_codon:yes gene_type:complete